MSFPWAQVVMISSAALVTLLLFFLLVLKYRQIHSLRATRVHVDNHTIPNEKVSGTMSGNLVIEQKDVPITDTYHISKTKLGKGSSAEVVIGTHLKSHRKYAIKIIDTSRHSSKRLFERYEREKNFLRDLDHTNIVRLFEVYCAEKAQYFVMELCTGGHLGQVLAKSPDGRLTVEVAKLYIAQLTRAVAYLHSLNICHRDIKLQNILLESDQEGAQIKLIDFGNSWRFRKGKCMTKIVGTTYTAAPEVLRESYDERCDVWSVGVVSYILLSGRRPFEAIDIPGQPLTRESSLIASILMGRYHFQHEVWEDVPPIAVHFIRWCLELDYKKRKYSSDLLNHPWLSRNDLHSALGVGISRHQASILHRRLSQNRSNSGLRRTSMVAVAFTMPADKMKHMRDMFQQIDRDGSGNLDRAEFHEAMLTVDPDMITKDIDLLFDSMDVDGDKQISFLEFVAATVDPREVDIQEVNQAFRLLDKDNKGYITNDDLMRVIGTSTVDDRDRDREKEEKKGQQRSGKGSGGHCAPQVSGAAGKSKSDPQAGGTAVAESGSISRNPSGTSLAVSHSSQDTPAFVANISPIAALPNAAGGSTPTGTRAGTGTNADAGALVQHASGYPRNGSGTRARSSGSGSGSGSARSSKLSGSGSASPAPTAQPLTKQEKAERRRNQLMVRIAKIIQQSDVNNDGVISYAEFLLAMTGDAAAEQQLKNADPLGRGSGDMDNASMGSGSHNGNISPLTRGSSINGTAMAGARRSSISGPVGHSLNSFALSGLSRQQSVTSVGKHNSGSVKHSSGSSAAGGELHDSDSSSESESDDDNDGDVFAQLEGQDSFTSVGTGLPRRRQSDGNLRQFKTPFNTGGRTVKDNLNFAKIEEEQGWESSMTSDLGGSAAIGGPASGGGSTPGTTGLSGVMRFVTATIVNFVFNLFGRKSARTYASEAEAIADKRAEQTNAIAGAGSGTTAGTIAMEVGDGSKTNHAQENKSRVAAWQALTDQAAHSNSMDGATSSGTNKAGVDDVHSMSVLSDGDGSDIRLSTTDRRATSSHSDRDSKDQTGLSDLEKGLEGTVSTKPTPQRPSSSSSSLSEFPGTGLVASVKSTAAGVLKFITTGISSESPRASSHSILNEQQAASDGGAVNSRGTSASASIRRLSSPALGNTSCGGDVLESSAHGQVMSNSAAIGSFMHRSQAFGSADVDIEQPRQSAILGSGSGHNDGDSSDHSDVSSEEEDCEEESKSSSSASLSASPPPSPPHSESEDDDSSDNYTESELRQVADSDDVGEVPVEEYKLRRKRNRLPRQRSWVHPEPERERSQEPNSQTTKQQANTEEESSARAGTDIVDLESALPRMGISSTASFFDLSLEPDSSPEKMSRKVFGGIDEDIAGTAGNDIDGAVKNPHTSKSSTAVNLVDAFIAPPLTSAVPPPHVINPHTIGEGRKREPRPLSGGAVLVGAGAGAGAGTGAVPGPSTGTSAAAIINPRTAGIKTPHQGGNARSTISIDAPPLSAINPHTIGEGRKREPRPLSGGAVLVGAGAGTPTGTSAAAIINPRTAGIKTPHIAGSISESQKKREAVVAASNINPHTSKGQEDRPRKPVRPLIVPSLLLNPHRLNPSTSTTSSGASTPAINPHTIGPGSSSNSTVYTFTDRGSPRVSASATAAIINPRTAGIKTPHTAGTAAQSANDNIRKKAIESANLAAINSHTSSGSGTTPRFQPFGAVSADSAAAAAVINPRTAGIKTRPQSGSISSSSGTGGLIVSSAPGNIVYPNTVEAAAINPHTKSTSTPLSGRGESSFLSSLPTSARSSQVNPRTQSSEQQALPLSGRSQTSDMGGDGIARKFSMSQSQSQSQTRSRPHSGSSRRTSNASLTNLALGGGNKSEDFDGLGVGEGSVSMDGGAMSNTSTSANHIRNIVSQVKEKILPSQSPGGGGYSFFGDNSANNSNFSTPRITPRVVVEGIPGSVSNSNTVVATPKVVDNVETDNAGTAAGTATSSIKYSGRHRPSNPNINYQKFPAVLEEDQNDNSEMAAVATAAAVAAAGQRSVKSGVLNRMSSLTQLDADDGFF